MTTAQIKRLEKLATESMQYARKAMQKSEAFEAYASYLDYKAGKVKKYRSINDLFKKLRLS